MGQAEALGSAAATALLPQLLPLVHPLYTSPSSLAISHLSLHLPPARSTGSMMNRMGCARRLRLFSLWFIWFSLGAFSLTLISFSLSPSHWPNHLSQSKTCLFIHCKQTQLDLRQLYRGGINYWRAESNICVFRDLNRQESIPGIKGSEWKVAVIIAILKLSQPWWWGSFFYVIVSLKATNSHWVSEGS